ncbi:MAG: amino acid permease [Candidatus Kariarchaeaceae archaeon]|jgi:amino acid transporter/nucleotide-binding universal stress UspA family protein
MSPNSTAGEAQTEFAKELGLREAISIAVGAMIGGGIFSVLGRLAGIAGPAAVFSFLFGGIIVFLTANAYYKLVAKYPSAGGEFVILRKGFTNPMFGNVTGMMLWLGYSVTIALYAFTFGLYLSEFLHDVTDLHFFDVHNSDLFTGRKLFAFLSIFIFMIINLKGVKETGSIQNVIVAFKVGVLLFVGILGFYLFDPSRYKPFLSKSDPLDFTSGDIGVIGGLGGMVIGSAVIFVSYEGFQVIANTVEELKNPARDVKIGMYISVIVVCITYCVVTIATFSLVDNGEDISPLELDIDEAALIDAVRFLGPWAVLLITLGAAASTTSAINATLLGSSRLAYVMSDYRAFPQTLATISKKSKVPYRAIIFTSFISWMFTFFGRAEAIAEVGSIIFLGIFLTINLGVMRIYPQDKNYIAKVASILIVIYILLVFIFFFTHLEESSLALTVLLIFTILSITGHFYFSSRPEAKDTTYLEKYDLQPLGKELIQEFAATGVRTDDFFVDLDNMLVPVSGLTFETMNWQISAIIARKYNVNVTLLFVGKNVRKLDKPKEVFDQYNVKYETITRSKNGKNIADIIIDVYNEGDYQLINLASRRKKGFVNRLFDTSVSKTVVDNVDATILQVHPPKYGQRKEDIDTMFMLFDGSERDTYLSRWANIIAAVGAKSSTLAYHIVEIPQTISLEDAAEFIEVKRSALEFETYARSLCERSGIEAEPVLLYGHSFVKSLVQATQKREPDAVLIGHTKDAGIWSRIRTRLAYRIMNKVDSAVIVHHMGSNNGNNEK